ncbi:sn-glycerol-3-phosphate ABC transporter ATP-binding protein UgpC [Sinirhodobacter populi]|uniref:sn-glycerol-3-phosphate ABC transporter ATP-binding protein UgpC n=1 Tax=Paenirhodobacter populi TaxID=2306993 RepID=A0A443KED3_9RHOB|nr:sn-glycerol-3-phosphate ABC transporter ATP-binding protein UgpC [Sinirhodobacter populi]RWR31229.1 sn-glycerol-3-phosphate ABC transporter ATP-binding protein UgpC [Sinirhodobacter populi]
MSDLRIENLNKSFGHTHILKGIDLDVRDGEFVALVGPSGCGKSTLLRLIAGLEAASSGKILIGGKDVTRLQPKERDVAFVFQNYALYPHLTVRANMGFSLRLRGDRRDEIDAKVDEAAAVLGLEALLDRYPGQLSGGQRQRVATGRAIVRAPSLFLFDEPLSNLDAKLRVQMRTEIKALHQRLGTTMVYVTHDQIEAMTLADRVVVMQSGLIEQEGAPLDLYDRPANAFVGSFLGSPAMNLLKAEIRDSAITGTHDVRLPGSVAGTHDGQAVLWGARPEAITELASGPANPISPSGFEGVVEVVEPTGPDTQLLVRLLGEDRLVVLLRRRSNLRVGDRIRMTIPDSDVHLFDAQTGQRIRS